MYSRLLPAYDYEDLESLEIPIVGDRFRIVIDSFNKNVLQDNLGKHTLIGTITESRSCIEQLRPFISSKSDFKTVIQAYEALLEHQRDAA